MRHPLRLLAALAAGALLLSAAPARASEGLTLAEALRQALVRTPAIAQAEADVAKARLAIEAARAERFTYSADLSVGDRFAVSGLGGSQAAQTTNVPLVNGTLQSRVPLFTGFRLTSQIAQADAALRAAEGRLDQQRQAVMAQAVDAYWQLKRAQLRETIQDAAVAQASRVRRDVEANIRAGRVGASERDRAEVSLLNQETERLRVQAERELAEVTLASLLGRGPEALALDEPPPPGALPAPVSSVPAALETAERERPELRIARANLALAQAGVGIAKADALPQLDLVSAYQHGNNPFIATSQARGVLDQFSGTFDVRLNAGIHLFDHGVIRRNVARAEADERAASEALATARRAVELEVRQALSRYQAAEQRFALAGRSVKLAEQALDYVSKRHGFGYALLTEVNEARLDAVTARSNRTDAQIDRTLARAALLRATGLLEAPGALTLREPPASGAPSP